MQHTDPPPMLAGGSLAHKRPQTCALRPKSTSIRPTVIELNG